MGVDECWTPIALHHSNQMTLDSGLRGTYCRQKRCRAGYSKTLKIVSIGTAIFENLNAASQMARYCSESLFRPTKANGEQFNRHWLVYFPQICQFFFCVLRLDGYSIPSSLSD